MTKLTQEALRQLFRYDAETGIFTNLRLGKQAGYVNRLGYREISIKGRLYFAHRLAWLYTHGSFPDGILDHANGNRDDNRLANLRPATKAQNTANSKLWATNRVRHKGSSLVAPE